MALYCADAFTDRPFAGNPAAVCVLERAADPAWMQLVAAELNLAETAFLVAAGTQRWGLRWFTPTTEVDLCGHATLASAHVLWSEGYADPEPIAFATASGVLTAQRDGDAIALDFPAVPVVEAPAPPELLEALRVEAVATGRNRLDWLVEVANAEEVRAVRPDFAALADIGVRGVMVTAQGEDGYDFVSRFFAPGVGVDEDPVTGSAHCALGPYWGARLGRQVLVGYQASARGGVVRVRTAGDRVVLGGKAVTVWRGNLA